MYKTVYSKVKKIDHGIFVNPCTPKTHCWNKQNTIGNDMNFVSF